MRIAILGPGGVGGFLAAALSRAGGDPWLVARERTAELLEHRGLVLTSVLLGECTVPVRAVPRLEEDPDVLLVATKASGLREALARVTGRPALVVPLLNGLEHMEVLRERFGAERVAAGVIRIESDRPRPAVIVQTSPTVRVDLASEQPALQQPLQRLAETLEAAQVPVRVEAVEAQVLWSKLVRLNALALTTSASDRTLGEIRSDPEWRVALEGAVNETAAVARAEGATLDPAATMAELEQAHAGLGSSMRRDIINGRLTELDAITGAVLRAARRHRVECPTVRRLAAQVARRAGEPVPRERSA
jgi:2-dehydropantoate 2-reductase